MKTNFFPCFLKRFRKTLSLFLAIAFLSSNIVYASADTPIFNLATPTNITSDQFQDIARVEIGLRQALKSAGIAGFEDIKSLDRLRSIGAKDVVVKNVFGLRITGAVHFEDARAVEVEARPGYIVRVNIKGLDYACLVRAGADGYKYETSVVPYSLFVRAKEGPGLKITGDALDSSARAALDRYIDHEVSTDNNEAIDPFIAKKMEAGDYAVDDITATSSGLYEHPRRLTYQSDYLSVILGNVRGFLDAIGAKNTDKIMEAVKSRPVVLIPYNDAGELPVVTINGESVKVTAHSSHLATYVFVPSALYSTINKKWHVALRYLVEKELVHETGAICGLTVRVKDGNIVNVLDEAFNEYFAESRPQKYEPGSAPEDRTIKTLSPVNLLQLEMRNDYASGKEADKRRIFNRLMTLAVASLPAAGAVLAPSIVNRTYNAQPVQNVSDVQSDVRPLITDINASRSKISADYSTNHAYVGTSLGASGVMMHEGAKFIIKIKTRDAVEPILVPPTIVPLGRLRLLVRSGSDIIMASEFGVVQAGAWNTIAIDAYNAERAIHQIIIQNDFADAPGFNVEILDVKLVLNCEVPDINFVQDSPYKDNWGGSADFKMVPAGVDGGVGIVFTGDTNKEYTVESTRDLKSPDWQVIGAVAGHGPEYRFTDTSRAWAFYRVRLNASLEYDISGRLAKKTYADGSYDQYLYWGTMSRVKAIYKYDINGDLSGATYYDGHDGTPMRYATTASANADIIPNIPQTFSNIISVCNGTASVTGAVTPYGMKFDYTTGTSTPADDWAGAGLWYDHPQGPGYADFNDAQYINFGIMGDSPLVAMEVVDIYGARGRFYIGGIEKDTVKWCSISTQLLKETIFFNHSTGYLDFSRIAKIIFIADERERGKSGSIQIYVNPESVRVVDAVENALTSQSAMLPKITSCIDTHGLGASVDAKVMPWGLSLDISTGLEQFAGAGPWYDRPDLGTGPVDLSGASNIVFGLEGTIQNVEVNFVDARGQDARVPLPACIREGQVRWFSIPAARLRQINPNIDLAHISAVYFIGLGSGISGNLGIHTYPDFEASHELTAQDVNLPMFDLTNGYTVAMLCGVTHTTNGLSIVYPANTNEWSTGGLAYNREPWTSPGSGDIVTRDFSALPGGRVVLGIRSEASRVKVEFHDKDNHSDVYITGVEPGVEKFCSIPVSALKGIDISRVRAVLFGVEREANPGSIDIRADVLGVRDFTVPAPTGGELFASSAPNDAATASWTGDHAIRISTSGSFTYCVTGGFTYPGEGANLVRNDEVFFGLNGVFSQSSSARFCITIEDTAGHAASYYPMIPVGGMQYYSIRAASFPGVDLSHVRRVTMSHSGYNTSGTWFEITIAPPEAANGAAEVAKTSEPRPAQAPVGAAAAATLLGLGLSRPLANLTGKVGPSEEEIVEKEAISQHVSTKTVSRIDEITDVLWQAGTDGLPKEEAKARLAKLAPVIRSTVKERDAAYDALIREAYAILLAMSMSVPGKYKQPDRSEIQALAAIIKDMDIEVYMPISQLPPEAAKRFRVPVENIFGDRLRTYQTAEDLSRMIKNPVKAVVMSVDLKGEDMSLLGRTMGMEALAKTRILPFEKTDINEMNDDEYTNYIAETLSILLAGRALTEETARDRSSAPYRVFAHLLECHMSDIGQIDTYIRNVADGSMDPIKKLAYLLKNILKTIPVTAYSIMKPAVEVLWSA